MRFVLKVLELLAAIDRAINPHCNQPHKAPHRAKCECRMRTTDTSKIRVEIVTPRRRPYLKVNQCDQPHMRRG